MVLNTTFSYCGGQFYWCSLNFQLLWWSVLLVQFKLSVIVVVSFIGAV
jgi:hypothetical protein